MTNQRKYYKSIYFDEDQEHTELGINKTNQRILVNHEELVINLLNYNEKVPIEVVSISADEYWDLIGNKNNHGLDWIDEKLTDLKIVVKGEEV